MGELKNRQKTWRFILNSNKGEHELLYNPLEWEQTESGVMLEEFGMSFYFSGDYTYIKDGYDYIKTGLNEHGILWECYLSILKYNNHTMMYDMVMSNRLMDFSRIVEENKIVLEETIIGNSISVPLTSDKFLTAITARNSDEVPYNRLETISGKPITPFTDEYETVTVIGQETESLGSGQGNNFVYRISDYAVVPQMEFESNSESIHDTMFSSHPNDIDDGTFTDTLFYYGKAEADVKINFQLNFDWVEAGGVIIQVTKVVRIADNMWELVEVVFDETRTNGYNEVLIEESVHVNHDEGLLLTFRQGIGGEFKLHNTSTYSVYAIEKLEPTDIKHVSLFNLHTRLIEAITDEPNAFRSSLFEEGGELSHIYLSSGLLYRRFPIEEANIAISFPDLTDFLKRTLGIGYGVEYANGKPYVVCEKIDYFMKDEVSAVIKSIERKSLVRELNLDSHISAINVGTKKRDYEQSGGLNAFSTYCNYSTPLNILDSVLDLESELQVDGNWHEYTRRLTYIALQEGDDNISNTDSKYDKDLCLLETTVDVSGNRIQRTFEDFSEVTGLGVITTPINLNLTPTRSILKWGKKIHVGLRPYQDRLIQFNSSEVATTLTTKRYDENKVVKENSAILVNDLQTEKLTGNIIKCNADISLELLEFIALHQYMRIQIPNTLDGGVVQGWIKEVSTHPVGMELTNLALFEAIDVVGSKNAIMWNDGVAMDWNDTNNITWNR